MTRPLAIIFLTILVNLIGFGIIIPLLPFYAETFGASPLEIGLLFAAFSVCQLVAAPVLGDLSDRYGRRPVLIGSLLGTVVSFVMLAVAQRCTERRGTDAGAESPRRSQVIDKIVVSVQTAVAAISDGATVVMVAAAVAAH